MKVVVTKIESNQLEKNFKSGFRFDFTLESSDRRTAITNNIVNVQINLTHTNCHFWLPMEIEMPHIDLLAFVALKIISPYIGEDFKITNGISEGVSEEFGQFISEQYKIKNVKIDSKIESFKKKNRDKQNSVISFSGGVDSVAVSQIIGNEAPLILTAEYLHPDQKANDVGIDESPVKMIELLPNDFEKIIVYTDFFFLNRNDKSKPYADTYSFTVSSILLAEHLGIKNILTGDILEAFCWSVTRPTYDYATPLRHQFKSLGIVLDYPCNGVSELITTKIAKENNLLQYTSACTRGSFQKPCMECMKCFRKSMYKWALFNESLSEIEIETFNNSNILDDYFEEDNGRFAWGFIPNYKFCFSKINYEFEGKIQKLKEKSFAYEDNPEWLLKVHTRAYENRIPIIQRNATKILDYAEEISKDEYATFTNLDWNNFKK